MSENIDRSLFADSLVESTTLLQTRSRLPALLSFAVQAIVAAVFIAVPLLHPELLPVHAPTLSLTPPLPKAHQPPPPPQHVRATLATTSAPEAPSVPVPQRSILATLLPTAAVSENPPVALISGPMALTSSTAPLAIGNGRSTTAVTVVPAPSAAHSGPLHISGGVTAGLLLAPIVPQYPAIAKSAHVEGTVIIHALISRTGSIEQAQVLSGSPMLQNAALEAVKSAHYKPYLLNGQPTEVDTTITVNFRLGS